MRGIFVAESSTPGEGGGKLSRTRWALLSLLGRLAATRCLVDQLEVVHFDESQARGSLFLACLNGAFMRRFERSDGTAVPCGFRTTGVSLSRMENVEICGEGLLEFVGKSVVLDFAWK